MKALDGYDKLRGGYYTPNLIAEFIVEWAAPDSNCKILEPSCGDGSFLDAVNKYLTIHGASAHQVDKQVMGIELDPNEAKKAEQYNAPVVNGDFFTFYKERIDSQKKYDLIVGNPPFIRYQNFDEKYRKTAFSLMQAYGFHPNRLTNIWLPFLLLSCKALTLNGKLGMVIPAELFQVDYAAEARQFLSTFFESLTIVTFKKLVFEGIQQEVILLLGERTAANKGIKVIELDGLEELIQRGTSCLIDSETKKLDHSSEKWVKYYLTNEELNLLQALNSNDGIVSSQELFDVNVGLVSGENDFFVLPQKTVTQHQIENSVQPIISRSEQLKGLFLDERDYVDLVEAGKRVFFFMPPNVEKVQLDLRDQKYIDFGEQEGYSNNYKCRIRKKWYYVPQTWRADAFLIRQVNKNPRMVLNRKRALVTDTLHKVRFKEGVDGSAVVSAFMNTYTFALCETLGRSYGGGVLTFEPGEARKMRIPMRCAEKLDIQKIDSWQREGNIDAILMYTDEILLRQGLNLTNHEIELLHDIWEKMRDRRLNRKLSRT